MTIAHVTTLERKTYNPIGRMLVLRRATLIFVLGMLAGYFWLVPVFVPPGSTPLYESGQSVERILRVLSVLFIFPLVWKRVLWLVRHDPVACPVLWTFVAAPSLSLLSFPGLDFIVATLAPFVISGLSLLCLCALKPDDFSAWVSGIGLVAVVFLGAGLSRYGLEMLTYYGRPRVHLGFIHPTQTAAVVLVACIFMVQWVGRIFHRWQWGRMWMWGMIIVGMGILLYLVLSRNTLLALMLIFLGAVYAGLIRNPAPRIMAIFLVLLLPWIGYLIAVSGNVIDPLWVALDDFSSLRFSTYYELVGNLNQETLLSSLVGPTVYASQKESAFVGFASIDSVYISLYLNYGLVTLISFLMFLFALGWRLSRVRAPLAYGYLCAVIIFFAIDAQGVTPSNLAIFLLLVYAVRNALTHSITPSRIHLGSWSVS